MTEGVIKFRVERHRSMPPLAAPLWSEPDSWRGRLWQRGLIGVDRKTGIGYGNISIRTPDGFLISGTQTGGKPELDGSDYVIVDSWDFRANSLTCRGPCQPSSEALSHAALYGNPAVGAVVHVHHHGLWLALGRDPGIAATPADAAYGSRELYEILGKHAAAPIPAGKGLLVVCLGHQDGVFAAAASLETACNCILERMENL